MHRHRFRVSAPVIPNASDSFCTGNTNFIISVGGCSFSVGSTLIKMSFFLSSLCSWRLSQVTELKGNEFEVQCSALGHSGLEMC